MANRVTRRSRAVLSGGLHPHYREVIETHAKFTGFEVAAAPADAGGQGRPDHADRRQDLLRRRAEPQLLRPRPRPDRARRRPCHATGALLVVAVTEVVSLGLRRRRRARWAPTSSRPRASRSAVALNFGGPYVGLFATRDKFIRQMPGRLTGQTVDVDGKRGWVLTLSTREQHIRREKATSNICTNSGLCALAFTIHLTLLGEAGLTKLAAAQPCHGVAARRPARARSRASSVVNESFFNEFTLALPKPAAEVVEALAKRRILGGVPVSRLYPDDAALDEPAAGRGDRDDQRRRHRGL